MTNPIALTTKVKLKTTYSSTTYDTMTVEDSEPDSSIIAQIPDVGDNDIEKTIPTKITHLNGFEAWNDKERRFVLLTFSAISFISPMTTTIILPALRNIQNDFQASNSEGVALLTAYVLFFGMMPLLWGPIADRNGRKRVALIAMGIFVFTSIAAALSPTIYWLIFFRLCQAIGSSSGIVVGIGAIGDTFPPEQRARAIAIFSLGPIVAPSIAPLLGGVIDQVWGWRAIFYVAAILGAIMFLIMAVFGEETHPELRAESRGRLIPEIIPGHKQKSMIKFVLASPAASWKMFRTNPQVRSMSTFAAGLFAYVYHVLALLPYVLTDSYGYTSLEIGLAYIPFGLGLAFAVGIGGFLSDRLAYHKFIFKNEKWANTRLEEHGPNYARLLLLWPSLIIYIVVPPLVGIVFYYKASIIYYLVFSFIFGGGLTVSRPSQLAYLYSQSPKKPSTATGILYSLQFLLSGVIVQALSPLYGVIPIVFLISIGLIWQIGCFYLLKWLEKDAKESYQASIESGASSSSPSGSEDPSLNDNIAVELEKFETDQEPSESDS